MDGLGMIAGAIGYGANLLTAGKRAKEQRDSAEHARQMQLQDSKELTDYQKEADLKMWKKTGPVGTMQELKKAGLSPGLTYGGSGSGGQMLGGTGGMTTQMPIPDANAASANDLARIMGIAQIGLTQAQTKKTLAEAENVPSTGENIKADTGLKTKQVESLTAGIKNTQASTKLSDIEREIKEIEQHVAAETSQDAINYIKHEAVRMGGMAKSALTQGKVDEATKENKIKIVDAQLANIMADTILKKVQAETGKAVATQEEFEAELTKNGLGKNSPWYAKLIATWLDRADKGGATKTP